MLDLTKNWLTQIKLITVTKIHQHNKLIPLISLVTKHRVDHNGHSGRGEGQELHGIHRGTFEGTGGDGGWILYRFMALWFCWRKNTFVKIQENHLLLSFGKKKTWNDWDNSTRWVL